jgi:hypothetical protein
MCEITLRAVAIVEKARSVVRWGMGRRAPSGVRGMVVGGGETWEAGRASRKGDGGDEGVEGMGLGRVDSSSDGFSMVKNSSHGVQ